MKHNFLVYCDVKWWNIFQVVDINFCSINNSSGVRYIFLTLQAPPCNHNTSSCFLNNPYLFADDRHIFLGQEINFTLKCRDKQIHVQENCI